MDPFFLLLEAWWWTAPAAAGLGAVTYGAATTRSRRARRLELDAARHEEATAHRALLAARAAVRSAQAEILSAKARSGFPGAPAVWDARRAAQAAKQAEKSAALELRASRARVKATLQHRAALGSSGALPVERLYAVHDGVNSRFGAYQTDPELVIGFPQLGDPRHPATLAFLRAQREAQALRPSSVHAKTTPAEFIAYRSAVQHLQVAFDAAERSARTASGPSLHATAPSETPPPLRPPAEPRVVAAPDTARRPIWPVPGRDSSAPHTTPRTSTPHESTP